MSDKRKSGASVPKATKSKYQPSANSSRTTYILGGLAILVIAALVIFGVYWSQRDKGDADQAALAANATMTVGPESAPTVDIFIDPLCPYCAQFEKTYGQQISTAVTDGKLRARYHSLHFLDEGSASGNYSSRAGGALTCVAASGNSQVFLKYLAAIYAGQPKENGASDLSNADLARIAGEQGADAATTKCIADGAKVDEAHAKGEESWNQLHTVLGDQTGTPAVLHDGKPVDTSNTNWLTDITGSNNS